MLDYVPPHTHTYRNLRSPRVFEREIVFSSSLYWNLIPSLVRRDGILSQGRDVIRGLSRARNLLVSRTVRDVRARTHWLENDDPKEISTQVEHLSLEISSFETHSQQQHQEGFLKTGNDCHFHSSNFTRGWTRGGDGGQNSSRAWDYLAMRAGANQYRWLRSRRNVLRRTCRRNPWCSEVAWMQEVFAEFYRNLAKWTFIAEFSWNFALFCVVDLNLRQFKFN